MQPVQSRDTWPKRLYQLTLKESLNAQTSPILLLHRALMSV